MRMSDRAPYQAFPDRPRLHLPKDARVAVWFIVNVEEWAIERPMPRNVLTPPMGTPLMPDLPNWAWHEYGMRVGFWRVLEALEKRGLKATMALNGNIVNSYPRIAEAALDKKAEFGSRTNVEFAVRIQVMDADETLKPGMSALVDVIPASRTGVLTLRHEFLQRDITRLDQATVTLENGETRRVTLGLQNEEMAEITDGLKEGERVRMVDFKASAGSTMLLPGGGGGRMPRGSVRGH
jgi:hypothetical protein